jgi:hypothetical protein
MDADYAGSNHWRELEFEFGSRWGARRETYLRGKIGRVTVHDMRLSLAVPSTVAELNGYRGTQIEWNTGELNRAVKWRSLACTVDLCVESVHVGVVIEGDHPA